MRLAAATYWYSRTEISQEIAAAIAGLNRRDFIDTMAHEKVDVFVVDFDDLKRELELASTSQPSIPDFSQAPVNQSILPP
jgi:hypothetical protein